MKKKLILVASPPACGKTYISNLIAEQVGHIVYLDKDDLSDIVRAAFKVADQELNMDGDFYKNNLRSAEYSTILHIAFSFILWYIWDTCKGRGYLAGKTKGKEKKLRVRKENY